MLAIPDHIRRCVAFVGYNDKEGRLQLTGSCFFVQETASGHTFQFVATALHLIESIENAGVDEVQVRVNLCSGAAASCPTSLKRWLKFPAIDLALAQVTLTEDFDHSPIDEVLWPSGEPDNNTAALGNEVFIPGLFSLHYGRGKNIPVIRVGNIAATPDEPINTKSGPMVGYIIECRSIGGVVGSPVFRQLSGFNGTSLVVANPGFQFLGFVQDHSDAQLDENAASNVNMGLGVAIPSQAVKQLLVSVTEPASATRTMHQPGVSGS